MPKTIAGKLLEKAWPIVKELAIYFLTKAKASKSQELPPDKPKSGL